MQELFIFLASSVGSILWVRYQLKKEKKSRLHFNSDETPTITEEQLNFYIKWTQSENLHVDDIKKHIIDTWIIVKSKFHTYGCIQAMSYLNPRVKELSTYNKIIQHYEMEKSIKVADIGCCFGQDTRQLILDGIPSNSIYSIDFHDGYWNAGIMLFQDKSEGPLSQVNTSFHDMTLPLNDKDSIESYHPQGFMETFDFIILQAVLHTISLPQQEALLYRAHKMLKSNNNQGVIMGVTVGSDQCGEWYLTPDGSNRRYLHSATSLKDLFHRTGFSNVQIIEKDSILGINVKSFLQYDDDRKKLYFEFSATA